MEVETPRSLRSGMFVAKVVGNSMEPTIPDGAYCLFTRPVTGTRQGRTVLVELRDEVDPDTRPLPRTATASHLLLDTPASATHNDNCYRCSGATPPGSCRAGPAGAGMNP